MNTLTHNGKQYAIVLDLGHYPQVYEIVQNGRGVKHYRATPAEEREVVDIWLERDEVADSMELERPGLW